MPYNHAPPRSGNMAFPFSIPKGGDTAKAQGTISSMAILRPQPYCRGPNSAYQSSLLDHTALHWTTPRTSERNHPSSFRHLPVPVPNISRPLLAIMESRPSPYPTPCPPVSRVHAKIRSTSISVLDQRGSAIASIGLE